MIVNLPKLGLVEFDDNQTPEQFNGLLNKLADKYDFELPGPDRHGIINAFESGLKSWLGKAEYGAGQTFGSQTLSDIGKKTYTEAQQEYEPTTEKTTRHAAERGVFPWLGSKAQQALEPIAGGIGEFAAPMAAGAVGSLLGPAGGIAAFGLADYPSHVGENILSQQQRNPDQPVDMAAAHGGALFQTLIDRFAIPGVEKGAVGLLPKSLRGALDTDVAGLAKQVEQGMPYTEAAGMLHNKYAQYLAHTASNYAGLSAMGLGDEALRRAQMGDDIMSPDAMQGYKEQLEGGIIPAAIFGGLSSLATRRSNIASLQAAEQNKIASQQKLSEMQQQHNDLFGEPLPHGPAMQEGAVEPAQARGTAPSGQMELPFPTGEQGELFPQEAGPIAPITPVEPAISAAPKTVLDAVTLKQTGLKPQSGFFKQLVGRDLLNPEDVAHVQKVLEAVKQNENLSDSTKQAVHGVTNQIFNTIATQGEMFGPRGGVLKEAQQGGKRGTPSKVNAAADRTGIQVSSEPGRDGTPGGLKGPETGGVDVSEQPAADLGAGKETEHPAVDQAPEFALTPSEPGAYLGAEAETPSTETTPGKAVGQGELFTPTGKATKQAKQPLEAKPEEAVKPEAAVPEPTPAVEKPVEPVPEVKPEGEEKTPAEASSLEQIVNEHSNDIASMFGDSHELLNNRRREALEAVGETNKDVLAPKDFSDTPAFKSLTISRLFKDYFDRASGVNDAEEKIERRYINAKQALTERLIRQHGPEISKIFELTKNNPEMLPEIIAALNRAGLADFDEHVIKPEVGGRVPVLKSEYKNKIREAQKGKFKTEEELEEEAQKTAPKQEPKKTTTPEQDKYYEDIAKDVGGGKVVYKNGDLALVRGYNGITGKVVYAPVKYKVGRARVDVDSFTGDAFTPKELEELKAAKANIENNDAALHAKNPFIKFKDGVAMSENIPTHIANIAKEWKGMLGIKGNVYFTTLEDAVANRENFTGPHRKIGYAGIDPTERGLQLPLGDGDYAVIFSKSTSQTKMLEVLAHELGHVHENEVFNSAPDEVRNAVFNDYNKWLISQKDVSARELVNSLRAKTSAKTTLGIDNKTAADLSPYWRKFSEWYADQVSRWATTSEKPVSIVEKFFAKLGKALKDFYSKLVNKKYLPTESVKSFLDKSAEGLDLSRDTSITGDIGIQKMVSSAEPLNSTPQEIKFSESPAHKMYEDFVATAPSQISKMTPIAQGVARAFQSTFVRGADLIKGFMLTEDLAKRAVKFMGSVNNWIAANHARVHTARQIAHGISAIKDSFEKLTPEMNKAVNKFIGESTFEGKWGYDPKIDGIVADPVFKAKFNALAPEAQEVVKAVFAHSANILKMKQDAIRKHNDVMFAEDTKNATTEEQIKQLTAKKEAALREFSGVLELDSNLPYSPLKRFGNYVVIAKSKEFYEAEKNQDKETLKKLKSDIKHYVVEFADTMGEANAIKDELAKSGTYSIDPPFKRIDINAQHGSQDLHLALSKIRQFAAANRDDETLGDNSRKLYGQMASMVQQMYLSSLAESSARKSEMTRRKIAGYNQDMMRAFFTQGMADAHFISNLAHGGDILDAMTAMRKEANNNRAQAYPYLNEFLRREAQQLEVRTPSFLDSINRLTSDWYLTFSPSFYMQQALQTYTFSLPYMGARYGYFKSNRQLMRAYGEVIQLLNKTGIKDHVDINNLPESVTAEERAALESLIKTGLIDTGADTMLHGFRSEKGLLDPYNKVTNNLRGAVNKIEVLNRMTTALATYRLDVEKSRNPLKAQNEAYEAVRVTHGSYDGFNTPRLFNTGPVARSISQFRRFQIIQLTMLAKQLHDAVKGDSPEARAIARKESLFLMGHCMALGGAKGLPYWAVGSAAYTIINNIFGDENEPPKDLESVLREHGGLMLTKGMPAWLGVDVSGKFAMSTVMSIAPYTDIDLTSATGYEKSAMAFSGPFAGGMLPNMIDGVGLMTQGDYYKGLEKFMPNAAQNSMKGYRFVTDGITNKNGDLVMSPDDISYVDGLMQSVGLPTTKITERSYRAEEMYKSNQFFNNTTKNIEHEYLQARKSGDYDAVQKARQEFLQFQNIRAANGYARQPLTTLDKAAEAQKKREKSVVGGVETTKQNIGAARELQNESE